MTPITPTLPVAQETFREMVRLHVYGRTDEAIAKELGIELRLVRAVRWDFQAEWDAAVEALLPTFTREMVFQTVAAIHLLASMTTDTKELATLAHAEERHLRLIQGKKPRVKKPQPQPVAPLDTHREAEATFTAADVAVVLERPAEPHAAPPTPLVTEPPPPTPPPDAPPRTFGQRVRSAAVAVLLLIGAWWGGVALAQPPNR